MIEFNPKLISHKLVFSFSLLFLTIFYLYGCREDDQALNNEEITTERDVMNSLFGEWAVVSRIPGLRGDSVDVYDKENSVDFVFFREDSSYLYAQQNLIGYNGKYEVFDLTYNNDTSRFILDTLGSTYLGIRYLQLEGSSVLRTEPLQGLPDLILEKL